ncbi:hypothetical protein BGZ97_000354 [Linnemannia gamsii]|uniref:Uncharacterized protein n=1 Tax=Linnemannia gamsii TaxID=64522 RepID=A0A9P6RL96_9FUNG|nr:hypothetical protein BGZ97_000354 [Linnemannia gamsii]
MSSTKEKKLSSKSTSTSSQENRKENTSATKTTTPLTPRTTPAPQEMPTLESHQTRRRCSGLKSNGAQCFKVCKTGYPDDVPFFCRDHIAQEDSFAAASPIIPTPAASPATEETESRRKDNVDEKAGGHGGDKENEQEDQTHEAVSKPIDI